MYHSSGGFWWWGWLCFCKVRGYMGNLCILPSVLLWILQCFKKLSLSSIAQSHPTLCNPLDCSMPGLPAHHQLLEFTQTHVHWISDAIWPSHPLSSPFPPALNLSQHQGLFKWVSSSYQVAKVLEFQLQHQSFQRIFRTDFFRMDLLDLLEVQGTLKSLLQHLSSKASICSSSFKSLTSLKLFR